MMKKNLRRAAAFLLAAAMTVPLGACGGEDASGSVQQKEWVYVPEYLTIGGEEEYISYYDMKLFGDSLYYPTWEWDEETEKSSQGLCRYSLSDGQTEKIMFQWQNEAENRNIGDFALAEDGSIYIMSNDWVQKPGSEDDYERKIYLSRFDASGKQIFGEEITAKLNEDPENSYVRDITLDGQGRVYLNTQSLVWLYDGEGKYQGKISVGGSESWLEGIGRGKDGKVYVCCYSHGGSSGGYVLTELDFDAKAEGVSYEDFPGGGNGNALTAGAEKDFLAYNGTSAFEYDLASQTKEPLFDWLDSDINGNYVRNFGALSDGRYVAIYEDWNTNESGVVLLTKTKGSEVAQKETIVVATIQGGGGDLQAMAVKFNKSSDKYHVSIKDYMDFNNRGADYTDYMAAWNNAIASLNNDITSKNSPDVIDLSGLGIEKLASKGVFEDLGPYLEKSGEFARSDFLENALEAYTYDGKLVSIPACLTISTIMGKKSDLGDREGWTMDEIVAFADAHPEAELFDRVSKIELLQYMMMFNEKAFINWTTGECKFNSDEFRSLLQFVNRFPDEVDYNGDMPGTPLRIQAGEVLLDTVSLYDFQAIQMDLEIFGGEGVCVGFPTFDGSTGHAMSGNMTYAIGTKSRNKEGAWAFIESVLAQTRDDTYQHYWFGFPSMKSKLESMAADAVKVDYVLDENGDPLLDENGDPIVSGGTSSVGWGGWMYTYHTPTQEEVDLTMELIGKAKPVSYDYGSQVLTIINEEAEPFFKGQKTVDEVMNIIQSRIEIYVSE